MGRDYIKHRSYFQVAPCESSPDKVVLCNQGFSLRDVVLITEPVMEAKLHYTFNVYLRVSSAPPLLFVFEKKTDCLACQRELTRAWAGVGEFSKDTEEKQDGQELIQ